MGWPKLLALVRHAESEGNVRSTEERAEYRVPSYRYALTDRGRTQAIITGTYLRRNFGDFDVLYVSYYQRSKETMWIMYPNTRVFEDPRLAEGQRGVWHTMTREQVKERFPEELERKEREGLYHYRPFGGENWPDIELRIHSFLGTLSRDCEGQRVLIVVHGHWLVLFRRLVERFSIDEAVKMYEERVAENASVTLYHERKVKERSRLIYQDCVVPWKSHI